MQGHVDEDTVVVVIESVRDRKHVPVLGRMLFLFRAVLSSPAEREVAKQARACEGCCAMRRCPLLY